MPSAHFNEEDYAFFSLGRLEGDQREQLQSHLDRQCVECQQALKQARHGWQTYGMAAADARLIRSESPPARLRRRVLAIAGAPESSPIWLGWRALATGLAVIAIAVVSTWQMARLSTLGDLRRLTAEQAADRARNEALRRQNEALQADLQRAARPAPSGAPVTVPPVPAPPATPQRSVENAELARLTGAVAQANTALAQERARLAAAQQELQNRDAALIAAQRAQAQAEQARNTAPQVAAVSDLQNRIRDLELQVGVYRRSTEQLQQRLAQQPQVQASTAPGNVRLVQLNGTEASRNSSGVALITGDSVIFFATSLPKLPPGRAYQLWLIRDRAPVVASAGVFQTWGADSPALRLQNRALLTGVTSIAVTVEPASGSLLPTGHKLLIGVPRG